MVNYMPKRKSTVLWFVLILLVVAIFVFSLYKIISSLYDYSESSKTYENLTVDIIKPNIPDLPEDIVATESTPITVDFDSLMEQNGDVVGWLFCENTPINYPVLQSTDNNYYLRKMINKKYNIAGSIFMDYRSKSDISSLNTIIYGHNMKNGTMFGTFTEYKKQSYYDEHPALWFLTPEHSYKIELIAGYVTSSTSDVYKDFCSKDDLKNHVKDSIEKSTFVSGVNIAEVDNIVTLSTCSYEYSTARYVLIGNVKEIN